MCFLYQFRPKLLHLQKFLYFANVSLGLRKIHKFALVKWRNFCAKYYYYFNGGGRSGPPSYSSNHQQKWLKSPYHRQKWLKSPSVYQITKQKASNHQLFLLEFKFNFIGNFYLNGHTISGVAYNNMQSSVLSQLLSRRFNNLINV